MGQSGKTPSDNGFSKVNHHSCKHFLGPEGTVIKSENPKCLQVYTNLLQASILGLPRG